MTPEQIRTVSTLARKYKISFEDLQDSSDWPAKYSEGFQHIQTLGKKSLNEYKGSGPSSEEPWRSDTYVRSQKLAALATKLEREQRNEAGWRSSLEPHILARFSVEVAWYVLHRKDNAFLTRLVPCAGIACGDLRLKSPLSMRKQLSLWRNVNESGRLADAILNGVAKIGKMPLERMAYLSSCSSQGCFRIEHNFFR